jgi:hypothetical protein
VLQLGGVAHKEMKEEEEEEEEEEEVYFIFCLCFVLNGKSENDDAIPRIFCQVNNNTLSHTR